MSFDFYSQRKAWQSHYEPRFYEKSVPVKPKKWPDVSNLPDGKWVKTQPPEKDDPWSRQDQRKLIRNWLEGHKIKYQVCLVSIDNKECEVYLFKKTKDAMFFKLAWG